MAASKLQHLIWISLLAATAALAAPVASVPSVTPVGKAVTVSGSGFAPGTLVTLRITRPDRTVEMAAAVAAADGSISQQLPAATTGGYAVDLVDGSSRKIVAKLKFFVAN